MTSAIRCPQCHNRLCDRSPSGLAAGHFRCRCKLEVIVEYTALSDVQLVIVPPELTADLAPFVRKRLPDGRGLVTWGEYLARTLK